MSDDLLVTVRKALENVDNLTRYLREMDEPDDDLPTFEDTLPTFGDAIFLAAAVHALLDRYTTTEASYQEAQLTIAGLEAEQNHYRDQARLLRERLCAYDRMAYTPHKEAR